MTTYNATAMPLTDSNRELLRLMNLQTDIPEEAEYICFLEDGDACFVEEIESNSYLGRLQHTSHKMVTIITDVTVEIPE